MSDDSATAPIAFRAVLPPTGTTLSYRSGEVFFTVCISATEKQPLLDHLARLENRVFYVVLQPEGDPLPPRKKRGRAASEPDPSDPTS